MDDPLRGDKATMTACSAGAYQRGATVLLDIGGRQVVHRHSAKCVPLTQEGHTKICSADTNRILQHGLEDRLKLAGRRADDAQDLRCGLLPLQRLVAFAGKTRGLRFLGDSGRTTTGHGLGWNGARSHLRLTAARFSFFAAFSRAPCHRLPKA